MKESRFPQLYVGSNLPEGWFESYATFIPASLAELREVVASLHNLVVDEIVGIDIRALGAAAQQAVLKLLEESRLKIILRVDEPVKSTVVSRCFVVNKWEKVEIQSVIDSVLDDGTKMGEKIRGLK